MTVTIMALNAVKLSVIMLNVIMLSVVMLNAIMLSVVAPILGGVISNRRVMLHPKIKSCFLTWQNLSNM